VFSQVQGDEVLTLDLEKDVNKIFDHSSVSHRQEWQPTSLKATCLRLPQ